MKPLKPSHREHKRYLLISGKDASKAEIEEALLKFVGILGYSKICPSVINKVKQAGKDSSKLILSVNRQELDKVRASFLLSGKDICIERVSWILNKL